MENKVIFGSFNFRAKFQIVRYVLEYTEIPYIEKIYDLKNPIEWVSDKNKYGLDFLDILYLIDGDYKLADIRAIGIHLVKRSGKLELIGKDAFDSAQMEMMFSILLDLGYTIFFLSQVPKQHFEAKKKEIFVKVVKRLGEFSKKLGDKDWLLGYLTLADFSFIHILEWIFVLDPRLSEIKQFQNLNDYMKRFYELEKIKNYRENKPQYKLFVPITSASRSS